jgi:hypothetical protein
MDMLYGIEISSIQAKVLVDISVWCLDFNSIRAELLPCY